VYLPSDAFISYMTATGAVFDDEGLGLLTITKKQYAALKPLVFNIGTAGSFALSPNAQIWPRAANADIGGNDTTIYLSIANVSGLSKAEKAGA
jgi:cathepsin E